MIKWSNFFGSSLVALYQLSTKDFILASQSPQRKMLLSQIDFEPAKIEPADIDETPKNIVDFKQEVYQKMVNQFKTYL